MSIEEKRFSISDFKLREQPLSEYPFWSFKRNFAQVRK
jgi:hypothetical protein